MGRRLVVLSALLGLVVVQLISSPEQANAAQTCATLDTTTLCISVPDTPMSGMAPVELTKASNGGSVTVTWIPNGGAERSIIVRYGPNPVTRKYSFIWPTHKYLDATGILRARVVSSGLTVEVPATIQNGNTTDIQHEPTDWETYEPGEWTDPSPPVVVAVGDGPDDRPQANSLAASIAASDPALLLFLGDIYETGTPAELWNHFGSPSFGGASGTLWGALATRTQPTLGNHEGVEAAAWQDYFHGRPLFDAFRFGGALFLNLNSQAPFTVGSAQYQFVQEQLATAPPCTVAFWHIPTLSGSTIATGRLPIWQLLAANGGDLVLNGHQHSMVEYHPLTGDLQLGGTMVQLISGAGGHYVANAPTDPAGRIAWSQGNTLGAAHLTLHGAENGGEAHTIGWTFRDVNGAAMRTSSIECGEDEPPPPPPPGAVVASDGFDRVVASGWGSAEVGGPWSVVTGSAANFSVDGSTGRVVSPPKKAQAAALAASSATRDVEVLLEVRQGALPSGADKPNVAVMLRWQPGSWYSVGFHTRSNGAIYLRGESTPGGRLFWEVPAGVTVAPGDVVVMRAQAVGANPTTVRVRVWKQGSVEPTVWQATASSSTGALQSAGRIGVRTLVNGAASSTIVIENLQASTI